MIALVTNQPETRVIEIVSEVNYSVARVSLLPTGCTNTLRWITSQWSTQLGLINISLFRLI